MIPVPSFPARRLPAAPLAPKKPVSTTKHNITIIDDYAWLRSDNWREVLKDPLALPPHILNYLTSENVYADAALWGTGPLRKQLVAEMRGRIKEEDQSVPDPDGPFSYYVKYRNGGQHPLICRSLRAGHEEALLLDADLLSEGKPFFDLGDSEHSPDHRLLGWSADVKGSELYTIHVRDLTTGLELDDQIEGTTGDIVWCGDSSAFYYVEVDDNHRPVRVKRHVLGQNVSQDTLIYEEQQPGWFVDIDETQSGAFMLISISDHETSEIWLVDRHDSQAMPRLVAERVSRRQYEVEHWQDQLFILTNADGAEDFKLVTTPLAQSTPENWRDFLPCRPGIMLLGHVALKNHLAWMEREDARPRIVIHHFVTGERHSIEFSEDAYALSFDAGYEFDTDIVRFSYSSMTTPSEIYDYNMVTRARTLRKRQDIPSGHNPLDYVTKRLFATSHDGMQVPISIVHRRELVLDGSAPLLLYGYGSYGHALSSGFRTNPLSLIDRGFVYAIAHVRGGTEKGWAWYEAGKREHKPNTFKDFIACADTLIEKGYTAPKKIVAHGGSAGGMLMGAVANMAAHLFAGIVADVPFVDVLNTMLDGDLPLTPPEWPEWGNPQEEQAFHTILGYSPYDNVRAQHYPAVLALGGLTDPRVTYWEPAKWVAKLRDRMTGGGPILLKTNMSAGHGGASGRFDQLDEVALIYAFAIKAVMEFGLAET